MFGHEKLSSWTLIALVLAIAVSVVLPAGAAATITVGSDLSPPTLDVSDNCILSTPPCSIVLFGVHAGNAYPAASPTDGTVISFGLKTGVLKGANETDTLRLVRRSGGTSDVTGAGTGPTITVHAPGVYSFPASMPIHVGELIGIDTPSTRAVGAYPDANCGTGAAYLTYHPVLTDGGAFQSADANSICELLVNAVVIPSNKLSFGKLQGNFKKGFVFLTVNVPGPGTLTITGRGVRRASSLGTAVVSKQVNQAGALKLKIMAAGKARKRLDSTGKVKVKAVITFSPVGGEPSTTRRKVKLRKRV